MNAASTPGRRCRPPGIPPTWKRRSWPASPRFLRERGHPAEVQRVVILARRRSGLGPVRNPTVLVGASAGYVLSLIDDSAARLDRGQRLAIGNLIRRDHEFHGRRRRVGPRPRR
jgi:hypothetical protein